MSRGRAGDDDEAEMIPGPPLDGNADGWKAYLAFWLDARAGMPDAIERVSLVIANIVEILNSRIQQRNASIQLKLERIEMLEEQRDIYMRDNDKLKETLRQAVGMLDALERTIAVRTKRMIWEHPYAFASVIKDDGRGRDVAVGEGFAAGTTGPLPGASRDAQHGAPDRQDTAPGEERPQPPPDAAEFW